MASSSQPKSQIIDSDLYKALIEENQVLRDKLLDVSALGTTMMFHTHRKDCDSFSRSALKSVVEIVQHLKVEDLQTMYQQGYDLASRPSVLEQPQFTDFEGSS